VKLEELPTLLFSLAYLREDYPVCRPCPLRELRTETDHVVLGRGNPRADLLLFGEGPGPKENATGIPFNSDAGGDSGKLLDAELRRLGVTRDMVFVDNVVACWPWTQERTRRVTRKPTRFELDCCARRVEEVIYRVDPLLILTLGRSALWGVAGINEPVTKHRGELFKIQVPGIYKKVTYPVTHTFHPAYLLRNEKDSRRRKAKNSLTNRFRSDLTWAVAYVRRLRKLFIEGRRYGQSEENEGNQ